MPTYEYTCKNCGENIEVFQPFSAKPLKTHDACGGALQKVFHARGVVFKGSGWYAKDSKAGSKDASNDDTSTDKATKPKEKAGAGAAKSGSKEGAKADSPKAESSKKEAKSD